MYSAIHNATKATNFYHFIKKVPFNYFNFYKGLKAKKTGTATPGSITTSGNDICMKEIDFATEQTVPFLLHTSPQISDTNSFK